MSVKELLQLVVGGEPLDPASIEAVLCEAMSGTCEPVALGAFLAALASRQPEAAWLAAGARALRAHGVTVRPKVRPLIDTCGTGGDGSGTFNVSTATAFVVAAAGCAVAKHGNRGVSSAVGSADVLEALGVQLELSPDRATELLDTVGFAYLHAPTFHPAMKHVAPGRRALLPTKSKRSPSRAKRRYRLSGQRRWSATPWSPGPATRSASAEAS